MTTATLDIFEGHRIPLEILMQRLVVLGTSGAGKTSGQRSLAERVWTRHRIRFGVFDSAEDWWGLASSADGKSAGIPVVIFGGAHGSDKLPLPPSGVEFARIVAELEQPWIADLKALPKQSRQTFVAEAVAELLRINAGRPLVVIVDEADTFAPENPKSKEANRSLDACEDLAKRGRKQGLYPIFITQRNAALSKDVTELCQVGLLYRAPGSIDQKVALGYLGSTVSASDAKRIAAELETMPDGECYVVSKAPKMRLTARVKVRQPTTYDSSATPGLGERKREPKVLATPDIAAIRERMAAQLERERQDDPVALRAKVRLLTDELKREQRLRAEAEVQRDARPAAKAAPAPKLRVQLTAIDKATRELDRAAANIHRVSEAAASAAAAALHDLQPIVNDAHKIAGSIRAELTAAIPAPERTTEERHRHTDAQLSAAAGSGRRPKGVLHTFTTARPGGGVVEEGRMPVGGLSKRQQRILDVMASLESSGVPPTTANIAAWVGISPKGGSYLRELRELRDTHKFIVDTAEGSGERLLTPAGAAWAHAEPLTIDAVVDKLKPRPARILRQLVDAYPSSVTTQAIADALGISPKGGAFLGDIRGLVSRGLAHRNGNGTAAADYLAR